MGKAVLKQQQQNIGNKYCLLFFLKGLIWSFRDSRLDMVISVLHTHTHAFSHNPPILYLYISDHLNFSLQSSGKYKPSLCQERYVQWTGLSFHIVLPAQDMELIWWSTDRPCCSQSFSASSEKLQETWEDSVFLHKPLCFSMPMFSSLPPVSFFFHYWLPL